MYESPERIIAERTVTRNLPDRHRFNATVKLYALGDQAPYFSATGELLNLRRRGDNQIESCGAMGDEITRHFPQLAPVVLVHLADDRGRPMHAVENAMYWAGLSMWGHDRPMSPRDEYGRWEVETDANGIEWAPQMLANHLRITVEQATELRQYVIDSGGVESEGMRFVLHDLEAQWQREADEALAVIRDDS